MVAACHAFSVGGAPRISLAFVERPAGAFSQPQKILLLSLLHLILSTSFTFFRSNTKVKVPPETMRRAVTQSSTSLARHRAIGPILSAEDTLRGAAARYSSVATGQSQSETHVHGGHNCRLGAPSTTSLVGQQSSIAIQSLPLQNALVCRRPFSAAAKEDEKESDSEPPKKKDLRDAVNRAKAKDGEEPDTSSSSSSSEQTDELLRSARSNLSTFFSAVSDTWSDLLDSGKPKSINKRIHEPVRDLRDGEVPEDDDAAADRYEGSSAIMVIDEKEHLTAWERMQRRLSDAPIIQGMLNRAEEVYEKSGASKAKEKMDHIREDAQEAWETSQNPWVYRASSVYDTLTAESEFAMAVRELRQLDPDFTLEDWKHDVVEDTLPDIMKLFLEGRIKELQPWLGEAVYNRLAAEIRARKKEGVDIDTHVLGIMNSEILACEPDHVNKGSPIILLHFMCQQINCVRKKKDGSIVEGSEDDIRANSYVVAFQREYDEKEGELNWKIQDFRFNGAIAYL